MATKTEVRVVLPYDSLCPDNRRFIGRGFTLTKRYRESKEKIILLSRSQVRPPRPTFTAERLQFSMSCYMPDARIRDVNNLCKGLLDSLEGIVYKNDNQIDSFSWEKEGVDRDNPRVEILVRILKTDVDKVTRNTRSPRKGRLIQCPLCDQETRVFHFSWGAITCSHCHDMVDKYDWVLRTEVDEKV